jgi:hypothetical protein
MMAISSAVTSSLMIIDSSPCLHIIGFQQLMSFISHFMISKAPHSEMGPLWYFFYSSAVFEQPVDGATGLQ